MASLRTTKLSELLRLNIERTNGIFDELGGDGGLARFLILEGYLDDTYYQYTSLFHSGRLSPNDNKFLILVRAFITPEPEFTINNASEVIAAMRNEDFGQSYVLNVRLVDEILENKNQYVEQTRKLLEYLSIEFEQCETFFGVYYDAGRRTEELLGELAKRWNGLVPAMVASHQNTSHIAKLLYLLSADTLKKISDTHDQLSSFVSEHLPEVLELAPDIPPERFALLNVVVRDLAEIKKHTAIVRCIFDAGLFEVTSANLEYVYTELLNGGDTEALRVRNFSTILSTNNLNLLDLIERNFGVYLRDVLLTLRENTQESIPAIIKVVTHESLDCDDILSFLEMQATLLPSLDKIPAKLHALIFKSAKVEPTWANCRKFIESEGFKEDVLIRYLGLDLVSNILTQTSVPTSADFSRLRLLIVGADLLPDATYAAYIRCIPESFVEPPTKLGNAKLKILIDEQKLSFSNECFSALVGSRELQLLFIARNIGKYLESPDKFSLEDEFLEELICLDIQTSKKLKLVELMNYDTLLDTPRRCAIIGELIAISDEKIPGLKSNVLLSLIKNSKETDTKISILNKYNASISDDEIFHVLASLPKPFADIKKGYNRPKLKNTAENRKLATWLDSRKIISSWSDGGLFNDDIKIYLRRG